MVMDGDSESTLASLSIWHGVYEWCMEIAVMGRA